MMMEVVTMNKVKTLFFAILLLVEDFFIYLKRGKSFYNWSGFIFKVIFFIELFLFPLEKLFFLLYMAGYVWYLNANNP